MAALSDAVCSLDGIWTWFNDLRAVWSAADQKIYYAGIRTDGTVFIESLTDLGAYDYYQYGTPRTSVVEVDDHDNPALCILDNGEILAGYSIHHGDSWSARANGAGQIKNWNSEVTIGAGADNSYVNVFQLGDSNKTLIWFYRLGSAAAAWNFRKSTDRGATWGSPQSFIESEISTVQSPYIKFRQNGSLRIDFFASTDNPAEAVGSCSLYAGYIEFSSDASTYTLKQLDGTTVSSPPAKPSEFTLVYNGSTNFGWVWDVVIISGNPVYCFTYFTNSFTHHYYNQARWNGSSITTELIVESGDGTADYLYAAQPAYSAGVVTDPNDINVVYLGKRYSATDFRIEQWTHTGTFGSGSWSKTADTSGNTSTVNARPFCVDCSGSTRILWWEGRYTSYTDYATRIRMYPSPTWKKAKEASPVWTASQAPAGIQAYYLFQEGSGNPGDVTGNGYGGTLVSTPTWHAGAADDFGPYMDGFADTKYVQVNSLAAAADGNLAGIGWIAALYKTVSSDTGGQWHMTCGNSGTTTPVFGIRTNNGVETQINAFVRNDASDVSVPSNDAPLGANRGSQNDGEFHVSFLQRLSSSSLKIRLDGVEGASDTTTVATPFTFDRGTIGCLVRTSATQPFLGEIHAVLFGWGSIPDRSGISMDLIRGQFSGTFNPSPAGTSARRPYILGQAPNRASTY